MVYGELEAAWKSYGSLILSTQKFQESLVLENGGNDDDREQYFGLSLRELIHKFKWQVLVLLKCMLLQKKVSLASEDTC